MENELMIFIKGNATGTDKILRGYELKPHSSGFDGEYYIEKTAREDAEEFEKESNQRRNERVGQLHSLIKRIGNRQLHIMPFSAGENWEETFKDDFIEFYKFLNNEVFDKFFKDTSWWPTLHFGIWNENYCVSAEINNFSIENVGKRFLLTEFDFDIIQPKHYELFEKMSAYPVFCFEQSQLVFFFEKLNVDILIKIFSMYKTFLDIERNINNQLDEFKKNLLLRECVDLKIERIISDAM